MNDRVGIDSRLAPEEIKERLLAQGISGRLIGKLGPAIGSKNPKLGPAIGSKNLAGRLNDWGLKIWIYQPLVTRFVVFLGSLNPIEPKGSIIRGRFRYILPAYFAAGGLFLIAASSFALAVANRDWSLSSISTPAILSLALALFAWRARRSGKEDAMHIVGFLEEVAGVGQPRTPPGR